MDPLTTDPLTTESPYGAAIVTFLDRESGRQKTLYAYPILCVVLIDQRIREKRVFRVGESGTWHEEETTS